MLNERQHILVVDDDPMNLEVLSRMLLRHQYQVTQAGGGDEALDIVQRTPVDLVLLDNMMPDRSGLDVLEEVRRSYSAAELPIIMVTAQSDSDTMVHALEAGANDYVTKPVNFPVLAARLQSQLSVRAAGSQARAVDKITGLASRDVLLRGLRKQQRECAVVVLDLDCYQRIYAALGNSAAEALLSVEGERLATLAREWDGMAARCSTAEFCLLLQSPVIPGAAEAAASAAVERLTAAFEFGGRKLFPTISAGVAWTGSAHSAEDLLSDAQTAVYHAKLRGKNCFAVFESAMRQQSCARLTLESDLKDALLRREFELYYQPRVELENAAIAGFEALIRWRHPVRGMVYPTEFIPVLEETGLIVPVGEWVLREAARQAAEWRRLPGRETLSIGVNVSGKQLKDSQLPLAIHSALEQAGVPPDAIRIEVTESILADEQAMTTIGLLRKAGLAVEVDDFGTGYSSLSFLQSCAFDVLKIDRSFVGRLELQESSEIIMTILRLSAALGMEAVAEGIETEGHWRRLSELGCRYGQGYYFSRPVTAQAGWDLLLAPSPTPVPHAVKLC